MERLWSEGKHVKILRSLIIGGSTTSSIGGNLRLRPESVSMVVVTKQKMSMAIVHDHVPKGLFQGLPIKSRNPVIKTINTNTKEPKPKN